MNEKLKKVKRKKEELKRWEEKKLLNKQIAKKLKSVKEYSRADKMNRCSEIIEMKKCPKCGKRHITKAELCRDRVCPICQWRLGKKRAYEMLKCLKEMNKNKKYKYQFLTLTQKNIKPYALRKELKNINNAWHKILKSNTNKKPVGFARVIEITYNADENTFHPHQHIIIAWNEQQTPITLKTWAKRWKKALNLDYEPICRIQNIEPKQENTDKEYIKAVLETYKYTVKSIDVLKMNKEIFKIFIQQISGTRATNYTGIFREMRKKLKLKQETVIEDIEEKFINCDNCGNELVKAVFEWSNVTEKYIKV